MIRRKQLHATRTTIHAFMNVGDDCCCFSEISVGDSLFTTDVDAAASFRIPIIHVDGCSNMHEADLELDRQAAYTTTMTELFEVLSREQ